MDFGPWQGPKLFCAASRPSIIFQFLAKNVYIFTDRHENLNVEVFLEGCSYVLPQLLSQIIDTLKLQSVTQTAYRKTQNFGHYWIKI
jgi:hypothetical protein